MNWEIYPESIYHMLKKYSAYDKVNKIIITENGAAFNDQVIDDEVHDIHRKQFIEENITQILRAQNEGINVKGYFVWTFLDNFEWAEGYLPRFGLVHVDFKTQKRIIKHSGYWYQQFLAGENQVK